MLQTLNLGRRASSNEPGDLRKLQREGGGRTWRVPLVPFFLFSLEEQTWRRMYPHSPIPNCAFQF